MSTKVKGYKPQSEEKVALVNKFKDLEKKLGELYMEAQASGICDQRMMAKGKTHAQQAFMWLNRSVFQPEVLKIVKDIYFNEDLFHDWIESEAQKGK